MKGLIFSQHMYNAVISGTKTMIRRLIKPQPTGVRNSVFVKSGLEDYHGRELKPRYNVGEKIYLKEAYYTDNSDGLFADYVYGSEISDEAKTYCTRKNKLFMPEKFARNWIEIISVKAERLNDISNDDICSEGIYKTKDINNID